MLALPMLALLMCGGVEAFSFSKGIGFAPSSLAKDLHSRGGAVCPSLRRQTSGVVRMQVRMGRCFEGIRMLVIGLVTFSSVLELFLVRVHAHARTHLLRHMFVLVRFLGCSSTTGVGYGLLCGFLSGKVQEGEGEGKESALQKLASVDSPKATKPAKSEAKVRWIRQCTVTQAGRKNLRTILLSQPALCTCVCACVHIPFSLRPSFLY
jgi:hypothetical protein